MKHLSQPALRHLEVALRELEAAGLFRARTAPVPDVARTFCSNDYLGLASDLGGAGSARLIVGDRPEHVELETELARWLEVPAALVFSSGYAANQGVLTALAGPGDVIISDRLNHASIIDGCRLSGARVIVVDHLDVAAATGALKAPRTGRAWIVTESYFSMDADSPDLRLLRRLCDESDAGLIVDEAHALGLFGPDGRGRCAEVGVVPDVLVGTLGKSFGGSGAFVAGSTALIQWLWNRARPFVFSTGISCLAAAAALRGLKVSRERPALRERAWSNAARLRGGLAALGVRVLGEGPILPVVVADVDRSLEVAARLRDAGIHVLAIRPPTVPPGTSRIRITTTARQTESDLARAISAFETVLPWVCASS